MIIEIYIFVQVKTISNKALLSIRAMLKKINKKQGRFLFLYNVKLVEVITQIFTKIPLEEYIAYRKRFLVIILH